MNAYLPAGPREHVLEVKRRAREVREANVQVLLGKVRREKYPS